MNSRVRLICNSVFGALGISFVALCLIPVSALAQNQDQVQKLSVADQAQEQKDARIAAEKRAAAMREAQSHPTPHMSDGHPDISGVWGGGQGLGVVHKDANGIHVIFQARQAPQDVDPDGKLVEYFLQVDGDRRRAENQNKPPYKEDLDAKVRQLGRNENQLDPSVSCHPAGVPRAFPTQIFATPKYVVFLYTGENSGHYRLIPITDNREHPQGAYPSYWGDSVAHWEGNSLIVDVTNFNDETWLGTDGWFHSTAMHVVERFTRDGNALHYQATVEDPNVFTRPWVENPRVVLLNTDPNNYVFEDLPCRDFDRAHFVNHDHF